MAKKRPKGKPVPKKKKSAQQSKGSKPKAPHSKSISKPRTGHGRKTSKESTRGKRDRRSSTKQTKAQKALQKKRREAALRGWETKRKNEEKKRQAAIQGWKTRRLREKYNDPVKRRTLVEEELPTYQTVTSIEGKFTTPFLKDIRDEHILSYYKNTDGRRDKLLKSLSDNPEKIPLTLSYFPFVEDLLELYTDPSRNVRKQPTRLRWYEDGPDILRRLDEVADEYGPYSFEFYDLAEDIADEYDVNVEEVFNFYHSH